MNQRRQLIQETAAGTLLDIPGQHPATALLEMAMPGVRRRQAGFVYDRTHRQVMPPADLPVDGVTQLWLDDYTALRAALVSQAFARRREALAAVDGFSAAPGLSLAAMGFPAGWEGHPLWR
ncbi:MAG: hypothetical protein QM772_04210 [Ottowia sp.]|uniref:hypothetical protein n=1 Tax=Ottowia sp. TaxID=1898956 RepID=UPI0039E62DC4